VLDKRGYRTLIPLGHFVPCPSLDAEPILANDLNALPESLGARILIPSADDSLRREAEARGFFQVEGMPSISLMERQFPDGVLDIRPEAFSGHWTYEIPVGLP
jgi:hypothetical protein